jgi:hypothetical protein
MPPLDVFETRRLAHELHWTDAETREAGRLLALAALCLHAAIADNEGTPGPIAVHLARDTSSSRRSTVSTTRPSAT